MLYHTVHSVRYVSVPVYPRNMPSASSSDFLTCTVKKIYPSSVFFPLCEKTYEVADENIAPNFVLTIERTCIIVLRACKGNVVRCVVGIY